MRRTSWLLALLALLLAVPAAAAIPTAGAEQRPRCAETVCRICPVVAAQVERFTGAGTNCAA
ncbi:MAG: hypothetical protein ACRDY7_04295 [Acidimicrobiia bacterium]